MDFNIEVNVTASQYDPGDMPPLWENTRKRRATGTKFGCGKGCGACTGHVDGRPCEVVVALSHVGNRKSRRSRLGHQGEKLREAWIANRCRNGLLSVGDDHAAHACGKIETERRGHCNAMTYSADAERMSASGVPFIVRRLKPCRAD